MDPNDPNQQYYYQPGGYAHYTTTNPGSSYAASSSGPTSPQNGFVPIYTTTNDPSQGQSSYPAYASSSASSTSPQTLEEHELKRLRNTAASARFRAKKKQREAQLESSAKDKKERLEALEKRIHDLEEENKWLKALIMEKKDVAGEVQRLRDRFGAVAEEMKEFEHKDGVGTTSGKPKK